MDLDGINRLPGKIRNCGGTDDLPTKAPKQDVSRTGAEEIVVVTEDYGATMPEGDGLEVVIDIRGRVQEANQERRAVLSDGQYSIQTIGDDAAHLDEFDTGARRIKISNEYLTERVRKLGMTPHTQVLNGGSNLLTSGAREILAARDGMVHADNPGQFHGWTQQRNPGTGDGRVRLVLITADGRQTDSKGLSISEAADPSERLGLVDAINFDGGGSIATVVDSELANCLFGGSERAVGDAIVMRSR